MPMTRMAGVGKMHIPQGDGGAGEDAGAPEPAVEQVSLRDHLAGCGGRHGEPGPMLHCITHIAMLMVLAVSTAASAAETLESVEKKISQQADKCKSVQMTMRETSDASSEGMSMLTVTDGRFECARKGDGKVMSRQEAKVKRTIKMAGQRDQTEEGTTLAICDGQFVYGLTHVEDQQTATKTKVNSQVEADPFDAKASFRQLHKHYSLKLLADAAVEGRDAYVIEATAGKSSTSGLFARIVTYYDKKTGLPLKSVSYDASGKAQQTMTITEIKVNVDIPAERFVFKSPKGVEVLDMTRINGPATTQPDDSAAAPELPDE